MSDLLQRIAENRGRNCGVVTRTEIADRTCWPGLDVQQRQGQPRRAQGSDPSPDGHLHVQRPLRKRDPRSVRNVSNKQIHHRNPDPRTEVNQRLPAPIRLDKIPVRGSRHPARGPDGRRPTSCRMSTRAGPGSSPPSRCGPPGWRPHSVDASGLARSDAPRRRAMEGRPFRRIHRRSPSVADPDANTSEGRRRARRESAQHARLPLRCSRCRSTTLRCRHRGPASPEDAARHEPNANPVPLGALRRRAASTCSVWHAPASPVVTDRVLTRRFRRSASTMRSTTHPAAAS